LIFPCDKSIRQKYAVKELANENVKDPKDTLYNRLRDSDLYV